MATLLVLARSNVPPDIQELLVAGNPMLGVPPGVLRAAIASFIENQASRIEELEAALRFYRDSFTYKINKKYGGLEWSPSETLLDDCGNIARAALGGKP